MLPVLVSNLVAPSDPGLEAPNNVELYGALMVVNFFCCVNDTTTFVSFMHWTQSSNSTITTNRTLWRAGISHSTNN